jgi:hypothetical protein
VRVEIAFIKCESTRYRSLLHRPDGVVVEFDGGSYNQVGGRPGRVPHDIAHLIVEDELRLTRGVWGVLVARGLFPQAPRSAGAGGRTPPSALARSPGRPEIGSRRRRSSLVRSATSSATSCIRTATR